MAQDDSLDLLRRLSLAAGPPGAEDQVREIVRRTLDGAGNLRYDRLGSLLCEKRGSAAEPRVVVDSHMDEVAFLVQSVADDGGISIVELGSWWGHVLLGQRVEILTAEGKIPGVIGSTPPHFLAAADRERVQKVEAMYIDVGASDAKQVDGLGIRIGDPVVPVSEFGEMAVPGVFGGKALDDRIGVALMCETLLELQDTDHPNTVIGVGAVQEELGCRGAGTASELARPDVALVLECTPADDMPGKPRPQAVLGGGPQVRMFDPTAIANRRLVGFVETVAEEAGIAIQPAVRRSGGTDAQTIHRHGAGVPVVVLAIPARYIHSHVGLMQREDYLAGRRLVLELIRRMDTRAVAAFTRFDS